LAVLPESGRLFITIMDESNLYPPLSSLMLVVIMNNQRDFEIARILGWYRIPLRSSPKVIAVDYLAFYQTAVFGENKWRINYIAPVRGYELTTRKELIKDELDHPRANQEYYKIQIGSLIKIPHPIIAKKWRRITFLYTTGNYFRKAKTINDLILHDEERQLVWQSLRDRASDEQNYKTTDQLQLDIDPQLLAKLLGIDQLKM
jgi:hypothetical protein